jgi:tetratricopeptide (TPR) repeat protein
MRRYLSLIALILPLVAAGCAHRIDVQHYRFGSPMHHAYNGIEFIDMGLGEDAMREFRTALVENPRFSPALAGKGIYWALAGVPDVSRGYIALAKRYAQTPDEKNFVLIASMRVALVLGGDGWFEDVTSDYEAIAAQNPNNDEALYWMGVSLLKAGDTAEAQKRLKRVVDLGGRYMRQAQRYLKEMGSPVPNP